MPYLSRRSFLLGSAALGIFALGGSLAQAQFAPMAASPLPARFSSVSVDVGLLRAQNLGSYAEFIRRVLLGEMQRTFADRLGGPGPALIVRITGVSLNSYAGSGTGDGRGRSLGGGTDNDYLDGEALVIGPRGAIIARYPQLSALPASSGGAWYDPRSEQRRTMALAQHYAAWLRRTIGG